MAKYAEFIIVDLPTYKDFDDLRKEFRTEIIEKGLDEPITASIAELQSDLLFVVNEQVRMTSETQAAQEPKVNDLGQPTINPPKSEEEILKFITNGKVDMSKYNKAKDYTTLSETGIVFGQRSAGQNTANRVALRMDISDSDTVETQYAKAKEFFKEAIFALPDSSGKIRYYSNPGLDITQFVKIKCSTMTGSGSGQPFTGMSPAQRFQRNTHTKGYADWTLKQDGVNFIRKSFVDLTDVMNFIKEGDYDRAKAVLKRVDKTGKMAEVNEQISKLQTNQSVPGSTQAYTNSVQLINNIQVSKKTDDLSVTYSLVSSYDDFGNTDTNFLDLLMRNIRAWVVSNEEKWFNKLVVRVEELIKSFESGK